MILNFHRINKRQKDAPKLLIKLMSMAKMSAIFCSRKCVMSFLHLGKPDVTDKP